MREWCRRRGIAVGALVEPASLWTLGIAWYGDRLDERWRRKTIPERQAILKAVGLTGPFWCLTRGNPDVDA